MFKYLQILIAITILVSCSTPKPISSLPQSREAECTESIGSSYKMVAWGFGRSNEEAEVDALKCAVYNSMARSTGRCAAIMSTEEVMKSNDFFEDYFKNQDWKMFVENTNRGRIDPNKRLKMEDGRIKLGIDVIVRVKELEDYLVAKKLTRKKSQYGG
jgi:hypothetical protein